MPKTPGRKKHNNLYDRNKVFLDPFPSDPNGHVEIFKLTQSDSVKIDVGTGPDAKTYRIPHALLAYSSQYFKNALGGDFKEAHEKAIALPTTTNETFELFLQWLYTGSCRLRDIDKTIDAWALGDYLGVSGLKNCAIESVFCQIVPKVRWAYGVQSTINPVQVAKVYRSTPPHSKLRILFSILACAQAIHIQRDDDRRTIRENFASAMEEQAGDFFEDAFEILTDPFDAVQQIQRIWKTPERVYEISPNLTQLLGQGEPLSQERPATPGWGDFRSEPSCTTTTTSSEESY